MSEEHKNLADSILMLEQILEVMPQDVDAIKALYNAYLQSGQPEKSFEYLNRLVDVASGSESPELVSYLEGEFARFESSFPVDVSAQLTRLRTLTGLQKINKGLARKPEVVEKKDIVNKKGEADISEELALAWRLYEENQLSQDDYSTVLHDLTEVSSKDLDVPISVLHVLTDRGFPQLTRIMNYFVTRSGVPFLSISNFEIDENAAKALPINFAAHEGALPFGFVGNDLLLGVLNPFNNALIDKIEVESGHRCRSFLLDAAEYDTALGRLRAVLQEAAA